MTIPDVYYDVKPSADECESVACHCSASTGCNEDCINRLVFSECSPQLCPCGYVVLEVLLLCDSGLNCIKDYINTRAVTESRKLASVVSVRARYIVALTDCDKVEIG